MPTEYMFDKGEKMNLKMYINTYIWNPGKWYK